MEHVDPIQRSLLERKVMEYMIIELSHESGVFNRERWASAFSVASRRVRMGCIQVHGSVPYWIEETLYDLALATDASAVRPPD